MTEPTRESIARDVDAFINSKITAYVPNIGLHGAVELLLPVIADYILQLLERERRSARLEIVQKIYKEAEDCAGEIELSDVVALLREIIQENTKE